MPIRSAKNEYRGVNAHLHSYFQNKGGWEGFHNKFIGDLAAALTTLLAPKYTVDTEQSLQLHLPLTDEDVFTRPDLTVYDADPALAHQSTPQSSAAVVTLTQPVSATFADIEPVYYSAVLIYEVRGDDSLGIPVTRIELLSPTNKKGTGYYQYVEKREVTLKSGLRLVELDFMHQTPSPIRGVPNYPRHKADSQAYSITVSDPLPDLELGLSKTYAFGVDVPMPIVEIPLAYDDRIHFDFGSHYDETYVSVNAYHRRVDYEQLPLKFESYSPADQERIKAVMQRVVSRGF